MTEKEEWKFYKDTRSDNRHNTRGCIYEVSNQGNVKRNGVIVEPKINKDGYLWIGTFAIHRAVAELFVPNPENKPCVDHINGIKTDNRECNLRWVTYKENCNNPNTIWKIQGENHSWYNKLHTKETINKMSKKRKEYYKTHKPPFLGHNHTLETIQLQSKSHKEYYKTHKHPSKGKHRVYHEDGTYYYE